MAAFRFRLQRILHWQEKVCRMEDEKLKERLGELAASQERLEQLALNTARMERTVTAQSGIVAAELVALAAFRKRAAAERQLLVRQQAQREEALAAQQESLRSERRRLQIFEKLREKAWSEHARETDRELEALGLEAYLANRIRQG